MLACVDAGNVKKAETPISPIPTAPETAANIFENRVMCASLSTGRVPSGVIGTRSKTAGQRCALVHAAWFSALRFVFEGPLQRGQPHDGSWLGRRTSPTAILCTCCRLMPTRRAMVCLESPKASGYGVTGSRLTEVPGPPEEARESPSLSSLRLLARPIPRHDLDACARACPVSLPSFAASHHPLRAQLSGTSPV